MYVLPPLPARPVSRLRRRSTRIALVLAGLVVAIVGVVLLAPAGKPATAGASGAAAASGAATTRDASADAPASSTPTAAPRPTTTASMPPVANSPGIYTFDIGLEAQRTSIAPWTAIEAPDPGTVGEVLFLFGRCPGDCQDPSTIRVTAGTLDPGLLVAQDECPAAFDVFDCLIYENRGGSPIPRFAPVASREEL